MNKSVIYIYFQRDALIDRLGSESAGMKNTDKTLDFPTIVWLSNTSKYDMQVMNWPE